MDSKPLEYVEPSENYENLPFHGMQNPPPKVSGDNSQSNYHDYSYIVRNVKTDIEKTKKQHFQYPIHWRSKMRDFF